MISHSLLGHVAVDGGKLMLMPFVMVLIENACVGEKNQLPQQFTVCVFPPLGVFYSFPQSTAILHVPSGCHCHTTCSKCAKSYTNITLFPLPSQQHAHEGVACKCSVGTKFFPTGPEAELDSQHSWAGCWRSYYILLISLDAAHTPA